MFIFCFTRSFKRLPTGGSYILNTRRVARYTTHVKEDFFNQKREFEKFTNAFSGKPRLHIVLGPLSTGKTTLIREVTSKGNFSPLYINCRDGQFDTPKRIYDSFCSQFRAFFE